MIKCVKSSENLTVGKLYNCYGLNGTFHIVVKDDTQDLICYLPEYFELENGCLVAYDENGEKL